MAAAKKTDKLIEEMSALVQDLGTGQSHLHTAERLKDLFFGNSYKALQVNLKPLPFINASADQLIGFCRDTQGANAWILLAALTLRGDAAGAQRLIEECKISVSSSSLSWSLWPVAGLDGYNNQSADVVKLLIKHGASPDYRYGEDGQQDSLLSKAVRYGAKDDIILTLIESCKDIAAALNDLQRFSPESIGRTFYSKAGHHVMMTQKLLQMDGGTSLRRIFDFEARRVIETLGKAQPIGYAMQDIDGKHLEQVSRKLAESGGDALDLYSAKSVAAQLKMPKTSAAKPISRPRKTRAAT